jgi:hypothetical protein
MFLNDLDQFFTRKMPSVNHRVDHHTFSSISRNASIVLLFSYFNICIQWIHMRNHYYHYRTTSISLSLGKGAYAYHFTLRVRLPRTVLWTLNSEKETKCNQMQGKLESRTSNTKKCHDSWLHMIRMLTWQLNCKHCSFQSLLINVSSNKNAKQLY